MFFTLFELTMEGEITNQQAYSEADCRNHFFLERKLLETENNLMLMSILRHIT